MLPGGGPEVVRELWQRVAAERGKIERSIPPFWPLLPGERKGKPWVDGIVTRPTLDCGMLSVPLSRIKNRGRRISSWPE